MLTRPSISSLLSDEVTQVVAPLRVVTMTREGEAARIEVRDGFFDVVRKQNDKLLGRFYTPGIAKLYFEDFEAQVRFEKQVH